MSNPTTAMNVTTVPTANLAGIALDYAVALATNELADQGGQVYLAGSRLVLMEDGECVAYEPSKSWAQVGAYINLFDITVRKDTSKEEDNPWHAEIGYKVPLKMTGATPQMAVARAVVAHCRGPFVVLPSELCFDLT